MVGMKPAIRVHAYLSLTFPVPLHGLQGFCEPPRFTFPLPPQLGHVTTRGVSGEVGPRSSGFMIALPLGALRTMGTRAIVGR